MLGGDRLLTAIGGLRDISIYVYPAIAGLRVKSILICPAFAGQRVQRVKVTGSFGEYAIPFSAPLCPSLGFFGALEMCF